jgi:hypothetical protein
MNSFLFSNEIEGFCPLLKKNKTKKTRKFKEMNAQLYP